MSPSISISKVTREYSDLLAAILGLDPAHHQPAGGSAFQDLAGHVDGARLVDG